MTFVHGELEVEVLRRARAGESLSEIIYALRDRHRQARITSAFNKAETILFEEEGGPVKKKGPWPLAYEYPPCDAFPNGQRVYRVGAGHYVQESALKPMGFRP